MPHHATIKAAAALAASLLALPAGAGPARAATRAPAHPSAGTGAAIVTTTPSAKVGGLPISSLDGTVAYVPAPGTGTTSQGPGTAAGPLPPTPFGDVYTAGATGFDISWPQCGGALPPDSAVAIVGADDGHPFSTNPCLHREAAWSAAATRAQVLVLDSPIGWSTPRVLQYAYHGPAGDCAATDYVCQCVNWGANAVDFALRYADSEGATSPTWWMDIELPASTSIDPSGASCYAPDFWVCDHRLNSLVIASALGELVAQGKTAGVYSTREQWADITGGLFLGVPTWIAGYNHEPAVYCDPAKADAYWFGGGRPWLVQSLPAGYDPDTAC